MNCWRFVAIFCFNVGQIRYLSPTSIIVDETIHARPSSDPRAIDRYVSALNSGATFPPIVAYADGEGILLSDGFLRLAAYLVCRRRRIRVEVRRGNRFDAILNAVAANADHGEPRTLDGIERAVLLLTELRPRATSRAIARHVQISEAQVDAIRRKHEIR